MNAKVSGLRRGTAILLALLALWGVGIPSSVRAAVAYDFQIDGVEDRALRGLLTEISRLRALAGDPPVSRAALGRRAEDDTGRMGAALRSEGFYAASVTARIEDGEPVQVKIAVETGPVYLLGEYVIDYVGGHPTDGLPAEMEDLGQHAGMWARGAAVDEAQRRLLRLLAERGRPLARVIERRVVVDHDRTVMDVTLTVDPGPEAKFSGLTFRGLSSVNPGYLSRLVPWRAGDVYDIREVEVLRDRLNAGNLFESVRIAPDGGIEGDGALPLVAEVVEAPHRSIGLGGSYATDEGFSLDASWEHRNLSGEGERLKIEGRLGEITQSLSFSARKPNAGRLDQDLIAGGAARLSDNGAYREQTLSGFVGVERKIDRYWSAGIGPSVELSEQRDRQGRRQFNLVGLPMTARRDSTDSILDPTEGSRLGFAVTPYEGLFGRNVTFLAAEASGSAYLAVDDDRRHILAGRFRVASIMGEATAAIPANKRLYAGGGGSIRGYALQQVGPLDGDNDPLGGRSAVEVGAEWRLRLTDTFGIVPFVEGGNVYDQPTPEAFTDAQWAGGVGFRYFTPVGPLRLDLAFPLNRRPGIDDRFQFYISFGQAF